MVLICLNLCFTIKSDGCKTLQSPNIHLALVCPQREEYRGRSAGRGIRAARGAADLQSARRVSADRAQNLAQQLGLELFEASAKDYTHAAEVLTNSLH